MTRKGLADALTRLISGENRMVTGLTALVLTGAALLAGAGLADAARGLRTQLAGSEIIQRLGGGDRGGMEPARAASFLRYVNAMAPAILNLEVLPDEQIGAFNTLYDAAGNWDVTLRKFTFDADGRRMSVACTAGDGVFARKFYEAVKAAPQFAAVEFSGGEDEQNFTIFCEFIG